MMKYIDHHKALIVELSSFMHIYTCVFIPSNITSCSKAIPFLDRSWVIVCTVRVLGLLLSLFCATYVYSFRPLHSSRPQVGAMCIYQKPILFTCIVLVFAVVCFYTKCGAVATQQRQNKARHKASKSKQTGSTLYPSGLFFYPFGVMCTKQSSWCDVILYMPMLAHFIRVHVCCTELSIFLARYFALRYHIACRT